MLKPNATLGLVRVHVNANNERNASRRAICRWDVTLISDNILIAVDAGAFICQAGVVWIISEIYEIGIPVDGLNLYAYHD